MKTGKFLRLDDEILNQISALYDQSEFKYESEFWVHLLRLGITEYSGKLSSDTINQILLAEITCAVRRLIVKVADRETLDVVIKDTKKMLDKIKGDTVS
jgi:hypothetical protein